MHCFVYLVRLEIYLSHSSTGTEFISWTLHSITAQSLKIMLKVYKFNTIWVKSQPKKRLLNIIIEPHEVHLENALKEWSLYHIKP